MSAAFVLSKSIKKAHDSDIFKLSVNPVTRDKLISVSGDPCVKIWQAPSLEFDVDSEVEADEKAAEPLISKIGLHALGSNCVQWSSEGRYIVSCGYQQECVIWQYDESDLSVVHSNVTKNISKDSKDTIGMTWAAALSSDATMMISVTFDGNVLLWDMKSRSDPYIQNRASTKGSFGLCCSWSKNDKLICTGHANGQVLVFSVPELTLLHALQGLTKPVRAVQFSPGNSMIAATGDDAVIGIYDTESGGQMGTLCGHSGWVFDIDFDTTGQFLLSCSIDQTIKLWNVQLRECLATVSLSAPIWSVKWMLKEDSGCCCGTSEGELCFYSVRK